MKNLFFTLLMIAGLSLSGQDLIVTYQQDVMRRISHYESPSGENVSAYFTDFSPSVKATWQGLTAGLTFDDQYDMFFWNAGFTLTITPQACLRTFGEGVKLGATYGRSFRPVPEWYYDNHFNQWTFSIGYQRGRWYGEVYGRFLDWDTQYGIGIGYALL